MSDSGSLDRFAQVVPAGTVLFREGDVGDFMYVIQTGEVDISRAADGVDTVIATLPAGEFFGEMSLLTGRPRSATATVRRDARVLRIEPRTFEAMLRGKTEIGLRMIRSLAMRLERANQQIELLLMSSPTHRVVQCLRQMADQQIAAVGGLSERAALYLPVTLAELATRVALDALEVEAILDELRTAELILTAADAGIAGPGYVIAEVGKLPEFVELLDLRTRRRRRDTDRDQAPA